MIDFQLDGVPKHIGQISDSIIRKWEGSIAEELDLTPVDVAFIKNKYPLDLSLQTYVAY